LSLQVWEAISNKRSIFSVLDANAPYFNPRAWCVHYRPVAVLCWGQGAQPPPKSCLRPEIFNWFYSNFP